MTHSATWSENELLELLAMQSAAPWAVDIRAGALEVLLRALADEGFRCSGHRDGQVTGHVDEEGFCVIACSRAALAGVPGVPWGCHIEAAAALEWLGRFSNAEDIQAGRGRPIHLVARLCLVLGFVAADGTPVLPSTTSDGPFVAPVALCVWDGQAPSVWALSSWLEANMSNILQDYAATLPEWCSNLVAKLKAALKS